MSYVYVRVFPNKKVYVGRCTYHPRERFACGYTGKMQDAINEFGKKSITSFFIRTSPHEAAYFESFLMGWFNSVEDGYNTQRGSYPHLTHGKDIMTLIYHPEIEKLIDAVEMEMKE